MDPERSQPPVVAPSTEFEGRVAVVAPHMDDETLACGGTIAQLAQSAPVSVIFTTDGSRSPAPDYHWQESAPAGLSDLRKQEARQALGHLGVAADDILFLDYPDGLLDRYVEPLSHRLRTVFDSLEPDVVLIPFRFDRHRDHLATHRAALNALAGYRSPPRIVEYFVYYRWRLVPGGDVRRLIRSPGLIQVDIAAVSERKLRALQCYVTQTTRLLGWQLRPILPPKRLAEVTAGSEWFLFRDARLPGAKIFGGWRAWIPIAHRVEPFLKRHKDLVLSIPSSFKHLRGGS